MIRAKKPWALAAAVALFAGTGIITAGYAWSHKAVHAATVTEAMKTADAALGRVTARDGQVAAKQKELEQTRDAVYSIIAGRDEQLNWIRLNEYINICLPQPDGKNLPLTGTNPKPGGKQGELEPAQVKYWKTDRAKEAAQDFYDRVRGGDSADTPMDPELRENLCHVDVESIYTLFTPSARQFYDNAKAYSTEHSGTPFDGMLDFDNNNPPPAEPAWGVAIHGSTYQKDGRIFLRDTLVYNIARNCRRVFGPAGTAPTTPAPADPAAPKGPDDPINDRVTHAFLLNTWQFTDGKAGPSDKIMTNYLKSILAGTGGAAAPAGGAPQGSGDPRDAWVPLSAGVSTGGTSSGPVAPIGGGGGGPAGGGKNARGGGGGGPAPVPFSPALPGGNAAAGGPGDGKAKTRTDFVVIFLWREPTPSDKLGAP